MDKKAISLFVVCLLYFRFVSSCGCNQNKGDFLGTSLEEIDENEKNYEKQDLIMKVAEKDEDFVVDIDDISEETTKQDEITKQNKRKNKNQMKSQKKKGNQEQNEIVFVQRENEQVYDPNEMVLIKKGTFIMGTDSPFFAQDGEGPAREVFVDDFFIDKYEVSNREFAEFVKSTNYFTDAEKYGWSFVFFGLLSEEEDKKVEKQVQGAGWWLPVDGSSWKNPEGMSTNITKRGDYPVVHVSFNDALKFCEWKGKRLPTEEEWEKAARGGLVQKLYSWGNKLNPKEQHYCNIWQGDFPETNTEDDGFYGSAPVYSFPPNNFGLYNMAGNVWEWTTTYFSRTPTRPKANENTERVTKGGSFLCHKSYCYRYRVAARSHNKEDDATVNIGFRCVKST